MKKGSGAEKVFQLAYRRRERGGRGAVHYAMAKDMHNACRDVRPVHSRTLFANAADMDADAIKNITNLLNMQAYTFSKERFAYTCDRVRKGREEAALLTHKMMQTVMRAIGHKQMPIYVADCMQMCFQMRNRSAEVKWMFMAPKNQNNFWPKVTMDNIMNQGRVILHIFLKSLGRTPPKVTGAYNDYILTYPEANKISKDIRKCFKSDEMEYNGEGLRCCLCGVKQVPRYAAANIWSDTHSCGTTAGVLADLSLNTHHVGAQLVALVAKKLCVKCLNSWLIFVNDEGGLKTLLLLLRGVSPAAKLSIIDNLQRKCVSPIFNAPVHPSKKDPIGSYGDGGLYGVASFLPLLTFSTAWLEYTPIDMLIIRDECADKDKLLLIRDECAKLLLLLGECADPQDASFEDAWCKARAELLRMETDIKVISQAGGSTPTTAPAVLPLLHRVHATTKSNNIDRIQIDVALNALRDSPEAQSPFLDLAAVDVVEPTEAEVHIPDVVAPTEAEVHRLIGFCCPVKHDAIHERRKIFARTVSECQISQCNTMKLDAIVNVAFKRMSSHDEPSLELSRVEKRSKTPPCETLQLDDMTPKREDHWCKPIRVTSPVKSYGVSARKTHILMSTGISPPLVVQMTDCSLAAAQDAENLSPVLSPRRKMPKTDGPPFMLLSMTVSNGSGYASDLSGLGRAVNTIISDATDAVLSEKPLLDGA